MCLLANTVWTLRFELCPPSTAIREKHYKVLLPDLVEQKIADACHWKASKKEQHVALKKAMTIH